ncbi:MAG: AbrB/MazE/SpoVT family DNA-binding domain-containing protein [Solirubrobacteraceae bacterium]
MRVTAKGQITIPQELRERMGLGPGAEVEVVPAEEGALIRPVTRSTRGSELVARLRDSGESGLTAEVVLRMTRGD